MSTRCPICDRCKPMHNGPCFVACYRKGVGVRGGPGRPPPVIDVKSSMASSTAPRPAVPWHLLPPTFGRWQNGVWLLQSLGDNKGHWKQILDTLTTQDRTQQGDARPRPSAGIIDAQSVKTAKQGTTIGYDAGKKGQGTQAPPAGSIPTGRVLEGVVYRCVGNPDADGLKALLHRYGAPSGAPTQKKCGVDGGYRGESPSKRGSPQLKTYPQNSAGSG